MEREKGEEEGATLLGEAKKAEGARKRKKRKDGQASYVQRQTGAMVVGECSAERLLMTNSPGLVGPRRDDDDDDE